MRAAQIVAHGDPSVLRVAEVPPPRAPTGDEIAVRVAASSINGTDLGLRAGRATIITAGRLPFVPGFDLAGEVIGCGPAVTGFALGDRVMALLGHGGGGQAEVVVLRQLRAARVPAALPLEQAAALPLAGLTALQALHGKAALHTRRAPRVLINGASGGIGSYAVQLAALAGAHVTAVASGPKLAYATALGAEQVVDYRTEDVLELGERWDVVLDAAGTLAFPAVRPVLRADGVFVSVRPAGPDTLRALVSAPLRRTGPRAAFVMTRARGQDLSRLAALAETGRLRPAVDRVFPLAEIADAHRYAEREVRGKVVVTL